MNSALFFLLSGAGAMASLVAGHMAWKARSVYIDHRAIVAIYCIAPVALNLAAIAALILRKK